MLIHNSYGTYKVKLKIGNLNLEHYDLYDTVSIPDGVYSTEDGVIVVRDGIFIAEFGPGKTFNRFGAPLQMA